jgi:ABC-type proline/glycine betaine transport system permease subunit
VDDHIQTLFWPSEEGYEPPPDPEPGDKAWGKLTWFIYPLIVISVFTHGTLSEVLNKMVWSLLVIGLLVTSEWSRLKTPKTLFLLTFAGVAHLCIMRFGYGLLPEHKRTVAIVFVSALEGIILGLPIRILNLKQAK